MEKIDELVLRADLRNTLIDVVRVFGARLAELSPEAKKKLMRSVLFDEQPDKRWPQAWKDAWQAVRSH